MKFSKLFFILILFALIANCSGMNESTSDDSSPDPSATKFIYDNQYSTDQYTISYFKYPKYNSDKKKYEFLDEDKLTESEANKTSVYNKVFFIKGTNNIARVDRIKFNNLAKVTIYFRDTSGNLTHAEVYYDNQLDTKEFFSNNILVKKQKISPQEGQTLTADIKHVKDGREERWYNRSKFMIFAIFYNKIGEPSEYTIKDRSKTINTVKYIYDKDGLIKREEYFTSKGYLIAHKVFIYDDKKYIKQANKYKGNHISEVVDYNGSGRESRIEKYDQDEILESYAIISYDSGAKTIKWYKASKEIESEYYYTRNGKLRRLVKYDLGRAVYEENYEYVNNVLRKVEHRSEGRLTNQKFYDERGKMVKSEKYKDGSLFTYTTFVNDNNGYPVQADIFTRSGTKIGTWKYGYNSKGEVILEEFYKDGKLTQKSEFSYFQDGSKKSRSIYNGDVIVLTEIYDEKGRVFKKRTYDNEGQPVNTVVFRYKRGKIFQEELYNKVDELERVVRCMYDKEGRRIREDGFDRNNQYVGTLFFFYDDRGNRIKEERYNWLKQKYMTVYYDTTGRPVKVENHAVN